MKEFVARLVRCILRPLVRRGSEDPYHKVFASFQRLVAATESPSILEVGSRNVTGITRRSAFPDCIDYVGLDVLEGEGVDVVADVHRLSSFFEKERFDFIFSASVFEHLLFPWKAVIEANVVLKTGGYLYLSTHPAWPAHELPWDFWRFPKNGFSGLFNRYTGFEIFEIEEGLPGRLFSLVDDLPTRDVCLHPMNQGVALIAKKTGDYRGDLIKWDIDVNEILTTTYPK